jgi:hypothetical protein
MAVVRLPVKRQSVKGKRVGVAFEKKIIKRLGLWWAGDPLSLYRSHGSGGRSTLLHLESGLYSGDVIPVKDAAHPWPFSIEIKKSETFTLESILLSEKSLFFAFWKQCVGDAKRSKKIPVLVCGKNHREPLVFFYDTMWEVFMPAHKAGSATACVFHPRGLSKRGVVCMALRDFVEKADRAYILAYVKKYRVRVLK